MIVVGHTSAKAVHCCCRQQTFRALHTDGNQPVLRSGPADETYVRSVLTYILEGISDVAEELGLGESKHSRKRAAVAARL